MHATLQPCNPAVGGPAKSQLVHEVDALGGEIGRLADRCYLQKRVLNRSKVPAQPDRHGPAASAALMAAGPASCLRQELLMDVQSWNQELY